MRRSRRIALALAGVLLLLGSHVVGLALWMAVPGIRYCEVHVEAPPPPTPPDPATIDSERLASGTITMTQVLRDGGTVGWAILGALAIGGATFCVIAAAARRDDAE